ncbi:DJ-1/PfpI family protein [Endomicrobium proavitum]|uniref:DJ-1/PfpI domain-containing protein n=1 Tax=Endomicrobium proavitum TaxID=1408281 RepID=A0A0G3WGS6_9BACT|nr:DJ-1/PfpI family protein [Endomicrobium proavitum]AKL97523.1 hypothetical protein Epro_0144 [Endomicrobium proavitum]
MKKAVFITAPEVFRDEEYDIPKKILEDAGVKVITASNKTGEITGKFGLKAKSDILLEDVKPEDFNAIVYIGGSGASVFFEDGSALKLANRFYTDKKITAAICIAPTILANAGILKGKKATVFPDGIEALKKGGAIYSKKNVETDGNIITAANYETAEEFGKTLLKAINKEPETF